MHVSISHTTDNAFKCMHRISTVFEYAEPEDIYKKSHFHFTQKLTQEVILNSFKIFDPDLNALLFNF